MPVTENEYKLRRERARILEEAREILDNAEQRNRDLTDKEENNFNSLLAKADNIARRIGLNIPTSDRSSLQEMLDNLDGLLPGDPPKEGPSSAGLIELETGKKIRTLRPDQRMADSVPYHLPDGIRASELSLGRFVRGITTANWTGAEAEKRAMAEGLDTAGGYLVPVPLALNIIDLARNQARCFQAGATTIPMESRTLNLAVVEGDPTAYWRAENVSITESEMTFGRVELQSRTLAALMKSSVELLEDAVNIDTIIRNALSKALALELDRAILRGAGAAEEPCGIRNWDGIQTIDMGTNGDALTGYDDFSEAWQKIHEENGPDDGISIIYSPREAGTLDRKKDGEGLPLKPPESWEKMKKFVTNQIPIDLTKGTAENASEAYVGVFRECLVGIRTQLLIEASRQAADSSGSAFGSLQVWIRAYLRADVVIARPKWFVLIDGIIPPG